MEKAEKAIGVLILIVAMLAGITTTSLPCHASEVHIIDNADGNVELAGQWQESTWTGGGAYYGQNYLHDLNTGKGAKSVKFRPALAAGDYAVYIRYTASTNRADNVPVDLVYGGQTASFTLNQREGGGMWQLLGAYSFAGDGNEYLEITTHGTNGYVIADAVAFAGVNNGSPCLDGLAAYWNMNEDGDVIPDLAGANIGWVNGAVPTAGRVGDALSFDGSDAVVVADAESLRLSNALTLCAWVKEAQRNTYAKIISRRSGDYFYFLGVDNGKPYAGIGDGTSFTTGNKSFLMPAGEWHHLAAVYDNSADKLRLYYDGVLQEEVVMEKNLPAQPGVSLVIGADEGGTSHFFTGVVDEVAVFNAALDAEQIYSLYVKGLNGQDYCAPDLCGNGVVDLGEDCDGDSGCPGNCRYTTCYADHVIQYSPGLRKDGQPVVTERTDSQKALCPPEGDDTINFVSLGFGGELILGFGNEIVNREGIDIRLTETSYNSPSCDGYPETVRVYASMDALTWTDLGAGCQDSQFDLGDLPAANYLKLVDESDPAEFSNSDDGFDVDGVEILSCRSVSLPTQVSINAEPSIISAGDTSILTWTSVNAETAEIGGIGPVDLNGSIEVSPSETTTYTIIATGPGGTAMASTVVTVGESIPPPAVFLSASPSTINAGEEIELTWHVENAEIIIGGQTDSHGSVSFEIPASGTDVFPLYETTTFRLTAVGPGGTSSESVTVNVILPPPTAVISVHPESITAGGVCELYWETEYAATVTIDNGIGEVPEFGLLEISPAETTTYTVTASGPNGTVSAQVTVTVIPSIRLEIISPFNGESISCPYVMVTGAIENPEVDEIGVTVNGVIASVYGTQFFANHVPLDYGENTLTVKATDSLGNSLSTFITVNADTLAKHVWVRANSEAGILPFETELEIDGSFNVVSPELTHTGGVVEYIEDDDNRFLVKLLDTGIYSFHVEAQDDEGNLYSDEVTIRIYDKVELDALLQNRWSSMIERMNAGDMASALAFTHSESQNIYEMVLGNMIPRMTEFMSTYDGITLLSAGGSEAQYKISTVEDGTRYKYPLYFIKDTNGLWKIFSF